MMWVRLSYNGKSYAGEVVTNRPDGYLMVRFKFDESTYLTLPRTPEDVTPINTPEHEISITEFLYG